MAETYDAGLLPRTYFRAPRVPFDYRALALAILGFLVYWGGAELLGAIFGKESLTGAFIAFLASLFAGIPFIGGEAARFLLGVFGGPGADAYTFWHQLVGGVWFFLVWSFFGQAVHRITSLRIARDEGLSLAEALKFAARNWKTLLLAPVIIAVAMALFFGCNALAGLVTQFHFIGGILGLVIYPLAVVSTLLLLLIGLGGVFGMPLIGAAAAWEVNGALDAISRAFSYVFARPLQYFWNFLLIFLFTGVILLVGSWFIHAMTQSLSAGTFIDEMEVLIDRPEAEPMDPDSDYAQLNEEARRIEGTLSESTGLTGTTRRPVGRATPRDDRWAPFVLDWDAIVQAPWAWKLNALILWVLLNLIWLGVFGYAVYWFLGASTSVYADLRFDVDGTEEHEIWLEEDERAFDELAEGGPVTEGAAADSETASGAGATEGSSAGEEKGEFGTTQADATPEAERGSEAGAEPKSEGGGTFAAGADEDEKPDGDNGGTPA